MALRFIIRGPLTERSFRRLLLAHGSSVVGDRMVVVTLAFAVIEIDGSAGALGLVFAARTAPLALCLLLGGAVADRSSPKVVMVTADLVRMTTQGAGAALLIVGTPPIWALAALAGIGGAATGFFLPAATGVLPALVAAGDLRQANAMRAIASGGGEIAGPALAGVVVAVSSPGWGLAFDAATFAASAWLLAGIRVPDRSEQPSASMLRGFREGWREFRSRTWAWTFVASVAAGNMLWACWTVVGPLIAERQLGGAAAWGSILAAMGAGGLLGGVVAYRVQPARPMVAVSLAGALTAVPIALLASGAPVPAVAAGALVAGAGVMFANALWESTLQRHVSAGLLSRVSAYGWFGALAFYPVGLSMWGAIATHLGAETSLWLAAAGAAAIALALLAVPDIRRLRPAPA